MDTSPGAGYPKPSRAQRLVPQQVKAAFFLATGYPLFPMAHFLIAGGLGVLETRANPLIAQALWGSQPVPSHLLRESMAGEVQSG